MSDQPAVAAIPILSRWRLPLRWGEPSHEQLSAYERAHLALPFNHPHVGASMGPPPPGWRWGEDDALVGRGLEAFRAVAEAIDQWRIFDLPWLRIAPPTAPEPGSPFTFASYQLGAWMLHPCRVVDVIDVVDPAPRHAVLYGTLAGHVLAGEERVEVAMDPTTERVVARVASFSRTAHPLARWLAPYTRHTQDAFRLQALQVLTRIGEGATARR